VSEILSILSGLMMAGVIAFYLRQVVNASSIPNPATWFIWFVVLGLNTVTYYFVSRGNIWRVITPAVTTAGILVILIYAFAKGRIGKVGTVEVVCLCLATVIGIFWKTTKDSNLSNLMLQIVLLISFVPTVVGLLRGNLREKSPPWDLAVLSYSLLIISILIGRSWTWIQLAHPIINGIVGNGSIAFIVRWKRHPP